jgi:hypothetical protein
MKNARKHAKAPQKAKSKTTRRTPRKSNGDTTIVFHGVQHGQLNQKLFLADLRAVQDGKAAREWLGLTQKDLGEALAQTREAGRDNPYSKQYISQLEHGQRPWLPDQRAGMSRLMTERIFKLTGETIGVGIRINSPWHIKLWRVCETHGKWEMQRANQKNCPNCKK